ncbi:hypothetical protein V1517DRAFT_355535 [Lipomyces orientalis]|uniref:Uncharacterized protein n=1 Tax=Lipomyces orientalis TaxID=1233043 RepID=A0ACC3TCT7_9ASCO
MVFESAAEARIFVNAYAIHNNFAVKNGVVKHKDQTLRKPLNTRSLPIEVGATGSNGPTRQKVARSKLCDCRWKVRFKKQLNDSWILTAIFDEHQGHQLEGINPFAYPENRSTTAEARQTMVDLVQHSSASVSSIASMLNTTYGLSLLGRDVYNRTYQYTQRTGNPYGVFPNSWCARLIKALRSSQLITSVF